MPREIPVIDKIANHDQIPSSFQGTARRFCWLLVSLAFLMVFHQLLSAQDKLLPVFHFNRLTTGDGLPTNEIRSNIVTDRQGFVWIGTVNGLARYDGYTCKVYRNIRDDPHSISSNGIMSLLVDSRGLLWVGTFDTGLSLYDAANDRFVNFLPRAKDGTLMGLKAILMLYEDRAGNVWASSYENRVVLADMSGLVRETNVDSIAAYVGFQLFQLEGSKEAVYIGEWDEQSLLFGTARGLTIYNRATKLLAHLTLPGASSTILDTVTITAFWWESTERLWIATRSNGLYLFDRTRESLTAYPKPPAGGKRPPDNRITDILIDNGGRLWISTPTTLDLFDPSVGAYKEYLMGWSGPPRNPYLLSVDRLGRLWLSTMDDGLYFLTPQSLRFPHFALKGKDGKPRSMETIDETGDGTYWIATEGKVVRVRLADLKVLQTVDLFKGKKPTYWRAGVMDSYRDPKGTLWYGSWGLGLFRFEPGTGAVTNYRFSTQVADVTNKDDVCFSITGGAGDSLWIGAYRDGLLQFDTQTKRFSRRLTVAGNSLVNVYRVMKDNAGKIWISDEQQGVVVLDPATNAAGHFTHDQKNPTSLSDDRGRHTYQDPGGNIWVGTKALNLWNPESRSFTRFTNEAFSNAAYVLPMGTDLQARLWVYYYPGAVGILDRTTGKFSNVAPSDGLCANIYEMSRLQNGEVVLLGWGGMNIISPESSLAPQPIPPLVLTRMSINDSTNVPAHRLSGSTLDLPHDQSTLEFEFAAIDPNTGQLITYQYRLEGLEDSWVHPVGRRFVRYPGLAPGDYRFRVKAVNTYGWWPDQEIALAISIAPPWWQNSWFRVFALLGVIGAAFVYYRREVNRLRRDKRMQQEFSRQQITFQEAERKRIAAELHDGLGQDLLIAANEIEGALKERGRSPKRMKEIAALIHGSVNSAREIASNLHPHQLDRLGLSVAVGALARMLSKSSCLTVDHSCSYVDGVLPKEAELHLYRIIQEALTNAVRHASAKHVRVEVKKSDGDITAVISDDGIGFNPAEFAKREASGTQGDIARGFGLASMAERAKIIGGTLKISAFPGSGTTITVIIPHG